MPVPYRKHETKSVVPCQDRSEHRRQVVNGTYRQPDVIWETEFTSLLGGNHVHKNRPMVRSARAPRALHVFARKERDTAVVKALVPWQREQHALESRVSSLEP